jgi:TolA-binding protein
MINQLKDMADSLIFPVAGFIILVLISIVGWGAKKLFTDFDLSINKVIQKLNGIEAQISNVKDQISDLKTENQLQTAQIREIEGRVELRFQGVERRLDSKHQKLGEHEHRIRKIETEQEKFKLFHEKNHPSDKF